MHLVAPCMDKVLGGADLRPGLLLPRVVEELPVVRGRAPRLLRLGLRQGLRLRLALQLGIQVLRGHRDVGVSPALNLGHGRQEGRLHVALGVQAHVAKALAEACRRHDGVAAEGLQPVEDGPDGPGRVAYDGVEGLVLRVAGQRHGGVGLELDHGPHLQASLIAQEDAVVVHPEGEDQLAALDEARGRFQAWLPVHAHDAPDQRVRLVAAALRVQPRENGRVEALRQLQDLGPRGHAAVPDRDQHLALATFGGLVELGSHCVELRRVRAEGPHLVQRFHGGQGHVGHGAARGLDVHGHSQVHAAVGGDGFGHAVPEQRHEGLRARHVDAEADAPAREEPALIDVLELAVAKALARFQARDADDGALVQLCFQKASGEVGSTRA
mmetsp:Transcript_1632/g.5009  ORF Transcript_1632/g.5009 Transcript_1632/m.5009 type:complete len:383 (+) Transcript_1632:673-1821(+)